MKRMINIRLRKEKRMNQHLRMFRKGLNMDAPLQAKRNSEKQERYKGQPTKKKRTLEFVDCKANNIMADANKIAMKIQTNIK
jgi:hypothetical protein